MNDSALTGYVDNIGNHLIKSMTIAIGGKLVPEHYRCKCGIEREANDTAPCANIIETFSQKKMTETIEQLYGTIPSDELLGILKSKIKDQFEQSMKQAMEDDECQIDLYECCWDDPLWVETFDLRAAMNYLHHELIHQKSACRETKSLLVKEYHTGTVDHMSGDLHKALNKLES